MAKMKLQEAQQAFENGYAVDVLRETHGWTRCVGMAPREWVDTIGFRYGQKDLPALDSNGSSRGIKYKSTMPILKLKDIYGTN